MDRNKRRSIPFLAILSFFSLFFLLFLTNCDVLFSDLARKIAENLFYTVTFNPANTEPNIERTVLQPGYTVRDMPPEPSPAPNIPDPTSTLFRGWFIGGDEGLRFTAMTPVTQDMTVEAAWNLNPPPAIVTFDSNGAHRHASPRRKAPPAQGERLLYLPEEPRKGWFCLYGLVGG